MGGAKRFAVFAKIVNTLRKCKLQIPISTFFMLCSCVWIWTLIRHQDFQLSNKIINLSNYDALSTTAHCSLLVKYFFPKFP